MAASGMKIGKQFYSTHGDIREGVLLRQTQKSVFTEQVAYSHD